MSTTTHTDETGETAQASTPRTRWAAIVWGLFFAAVAVIGFTTLIDQGRRGDLADWAMGLTPGTITAAALLGVGTIMLVAGIGGLARRAQRRFDD